MLLRGRPAPRVLLHQASRDRRGLARGRETQRERGEEEHDRHHRRCARQERRRPPPSEERLARARAKRARESAALPRLEQDRHDERDAREHVDGRDDRDHEARHLLPSDEITLKGPVVEDTTWPREASIRPRTVRCRRPQSARDREEPGRIQGGTAHQKTVDLR